MRYRNLRALIHRLVSDDEGAEVIEYAMIVGLIIVATITTVAAFGTKVLSKWTSLNSSM